MAYSKSLAARIRQMLSQRHGVIEKKMFGGVAFLLRGNMLVGVWQDAMIARLGVPQAEIALRQDGVRAFDITGRPMKGWVMIEPEALDLDGQLTDWIDQAWQFVAELPAK